MKNDIAEKIRQLKEQIKKHNRLYYRNNTPEISDGQYDKLFAELKELEKQNPELITADSPTQKVGEKPDTHFKQVEHSIPMLSIDNTYNPEELRAFDKRIKKTLEPTNYNYAVELKIDGLAVSLRYEKGNLVLGATRGDGSKGENVTANIKTIKNIPHKLKNYSQDVLEVRGEVYMPKKAFAELNEARELQGLNLFANPRNAAAGALKLLNAKITAERNLAFFAYALGEQSEPLAESHLECLRKLKILGFDVNPNTKKAKNIDDVIKICSSWQDKRYSLDYQIDGMVIKVDSLGEQKKLGATGRAPRWCISYKFAAEQAETKITSIDVQVGKTGILTPVANFEPVELAGTTVKRASLHNFDEVARLDVRVNDVVNIEKAGEIIPQVIEVKKNKRAENTRQVKTPEHCPVCNGSVAKDENGVYIRCTNANCPAQLKEKLKFFAARDQMDIENLGTAVIEQLVNKNLVKNFADIYNLTVFDIMSLERMGNKSAENILNAIEKSKSQSLDRFIAALGIPNIGTQTAEILAEAFGSIENLKNASEDELTEIAQIGSVLAKSICDYFKNEKNLAVIEKLIEKGINPKADVKITNNILEGKTFVATGTLKNFSRTEIAKVIKQNGGKVVSSISKKTDFLLAGENAGSKLEKAGKLGVKVISEDEFLKLIG